MTEIRIISPKRVDCQWDGAPKGQLGPPAGLNAQHCPDRVDRKVNHTRHAGFPTYSPTALPVYRPTRLPSEPLRSPPRGGPESPRARPRLCTSQPRGSPSPAGGVTGQGLDRAGRRREVPQHADSTDRRLIPGANAVLWSAARTGAREAGGVDCGTRIRCRRRHRPPTGTGVDPRLVERGGSPQGAVSWCVPHRERYRPVGPISGRSRAMRGHLVGHDGQGSRARSPRPMSGSSAPRLAWRVSAEVPAGRPGVEARAPDPTVTPRGAS